MYLTVSQIALEVQSNLNTIAQELYEAETITNQVVFYVTADTSTYNRITEGEFSVGLDIPYTPVLLKRVSSGMQDDFVQGIYRDSYVCELLGYEDDKTSLEKIFSQYVYDETETDSKTIGSWTVLKAYTQDVTFVNTVNATDGTNRERIVYMFSFTWDFIIGGISDSASNFTINGSAIDVVGVSYISDKISIANIPYGTNVRPLGSTGFTLSLTIPMIDSTTNKNLFADLVSKSFNKSYTVAWTITGYGSVSYSMTLVRGSVNYQRDQLISYTVTFEEALARTTFTVDSVSLPVLAMTYSRKSTPANNADGTEIKTTLTDSGYSIMATFAYDSTVAKNVELLQAILNSDYMLSTYEINIGVTGGISETYTCYMLDGTYHYDQTGELSYQCTFVEVHPNGI